MILTESMEPVMPRRVQGWPCLPKEFFNHPAKCEASQMVRMVFLGVERNS